MVSKFNELINSKDIVLVDFFATWCGPCVTMGTILQNLRTELNSSVSIVKVDIDRNGEVANLFNVRSVPTLALFKKGQLIWQQSGVLPQDVLKTEIEKLYT